MPNATTIDSTDTGEPVMGNPAESPTEDENARSLYIQHQYALRREFEERTESSASPFGTYVSQEDSGPAMKPSDVENPLQSLHNRTGGIPESYYEAWRLLRERRQEQLPVERELNQSQPSYSSIVDPESGIAGTRLTDSEDLDSGEHSSGRYSYPPLRSGCHRLTILHPGSFPDSLRVTLVQVPFSGTDIPEYEAISYACGDLSRNLVTVRVIDGESKMGQGYLHIGQNLAIALRHLRRSSQPRTVWCDAISINQFVNEEKSAEILSMSEIYRKASRVVIWLGPQGDYSHNALDALEHLGNQVDTRSSHDTANPAKGKDPNWTYANRPLPFEDSTWRAIQKLVGRAWFTRLWVWQESSLANSDTAVALCGYRPIRWDVFTGAIVCIRWKAADPTGMSSEVIRGFKKDIALIHSLFNCQSATRIDELIALTKRCQCSDARDRVYAILSMEHNSISLADGIIPDYSKSKAQVYTELVVAEYTRFHWLRLMGFAGFGRGDIPTWIPDLEVETRTTVAWGRASGRAEAYLEIDGNKAKVLGVRCGIIKTVHPQMPSQCSIEEMKPVLQSWLSKDLTSSTSPDGKSSVHALASLLTMGAVGERYPEAPFMATFDQIHKIFRQDLSFPNKKRCIDMRYGAPQWYDAFYHRLHACLPGWCFFETTDQHFGLAPVDVRSGDTIYTILGCNVPLALRRSQPENRPDQFAVVGSCYLEGYMEAEALLGPFPQGWSYAEVGDHLLFLDEHGHCTRNDPRLGSVPFPWYQRSYADGGICWMNLISREYSWFDPRLSPQALRDRKVDLEDIVLA